MIKRYLNKKGYSIWFMASLLLVLMAGCAKDDNGGGGGPPADTTKPTVTLTNPINAATGVATNQKIAAYFSETVAPASCTPGTFTLSQGPNLISGTVKCTGAAAIFAPGTALTASTQYTATITTGVTDLAGNALAFNKVWTFTTGSGVDSTRPTVFSTTPAVGATNVALNTNITATFSKAMDPQSITTTTFTLTHGTTVDTGVVSSTSTVATLNPNSNLIASTQYTATITTGVEDLAGNAMAATYSWSFTTGTTILTSPATVVLGKAANYAILAETGVASVPNSVVTGNVGLNPAARGFLTGWSLITEPTDTSFTSAQEVSSFKLYVADNVGATTSSDLTTAVSNMETAYTDAAGRTASSAATTNVGSGTLTSLTLTTGVYQWGSAVTIPTDLTLSGKATDVWIFKVNGTLDMAAAKNVILTGGALAKNVFWQVTGAVTMGPAKNVFWQVTGAVTM